MRTIRVILSAVLAPLLLAVLASSSVEAAPQKIERTVVGSYNAYPSPVTGCNELVGSWACMIVRTRPTERFVSVKVTDTHGLPVYFTVFNGGTPTGFCGETKGPVAFSQGRDLEIEVGVSRWITQTECPASSVKTTGKIEVTLSNLR